MSIKPEENSLFKITELHDSVIPISETARNKAIEKKSSETKTKINVT